MAVTLVRVIGCGNPDAGDDAAGLVAVRAVKPRLDRFPGVEVLEIRSPVRLIEEIEGVRGTVVVDAVRSPGGGRRAGEIVRIEAGPEGLPAEVRSTVSSHGLGVAETVGLAAALGKVSRLVFLGVEAGDVTAGHGLSGPVADAMPGLIRRIEHEVHLLLEAGS